MTLDYKTVLSIVAGIVLLGFIAKRQAAQAANAVNPLNNHNVFAQAADGVVKSVTGGESKTVGSAWYKHCQARDFAPWYCPASP